MRLVNSSNLLEFNETIHDLRQRHKRIVPLLSAGLRELEREGEAAANRRCGPGGLDGWVATIEADQLRFNGGVFSLDGKRKFLVSETFEKFTARNKGVELANALLKKGAASLLQEFKSSS